MPTQTAIDEVVTEIQARLNHVGIRTNELDAAIKAWTAANPIKLEAVIDPDRLAWRLILTLDPAPPLKTWGFMFGDAIHNLRSLLDNLLVAIARAEGVTGSKLSKIQFPTATTETAWTESRWRIASLPALVRESIESVQPFQRLAESRDPEQDGLFRLSRLNNVDKHRIALQGDLKPETLSHDVAVELEEDPGVDVTPVVHFSGDIVDGATLLHYNSAPYRIAKVKGAARLDAKVLTTDDAGNAVGVLEGLMGYTEYVGQVASLVTSAWIEGGA